MKNLALIIVTLIALSLPTAAQPLLRGYMTTNGALVQMNPRITSLHTSGDLTNEGTIYTSTSGINFSGGVTAQETDGYLLVTPTIRPSGVTASRVAIFDSDKNLMASISVDTGEIEFLNGVTANLGTNIVIRTSGTNDMILGLNAGTNVFRWQTNGLILVGAGTAARPGLAFIEDPDTGIYFSSTLLNVAVDGSVKFSVDSGANLYAYGGGLYMGSSSLNRAALNVDGENIVAVRNTVHDRSAVTNRFYMAHAGTPTSEPTNAVWAEIAADTNHNWFALRVLADGSNQVRRPLALGVGTNPAVRIETNGIVSFTAGSAQIPPFVRAGGAFFTQTNAVWPTNKTYTSILNGAGPIGTTLPANFFETNRSYIIEMEGRFNASGPGTAMIFTNQLRIGGSMVASNLYDTGSLNVVANYPTRLKIRLTPISLGASGKIRVTGHLAGPSDAPAADGTIRMQEFAWVPTSTLITVDTTASQTLGIHVAANLDPGDDLTNNWLLWESGNIRVE